MIRSDKEKRIFPYVLPTVMFISVFIGCVALGPYLFNADGDLGRHLTLGKYILDTGQIPTQDIFSHTMLGEPLSPHEWWAAVLFQLFHKWMGLTGVVIFTAAILSSVFWLITRQVYQLTRSSVITLVLVVVGIAGSRIHWLARPHIFTFLFLFLWIQILNAGLSFWKKWVLAVGLMLIWVNTHGAFVTGYVYLGILIFGTWVDGYRFKNGKDSIKDIKEYLLIFITVLLASLANPSGQEIWQTILGFLSSRYLVSHTVEYMAPVLYKAGVIPFTLLVVISAVIIAIRYKTMQTTKILVLISFAVFGITSGRNIPLFILVSLPILAEEAILIFPRLRMQLDDQFSLPPAQNKTSLAENLSILGMTIGLVVLLGAGVFQLVPGLSARNQYDPTKFPVRAMDWWIEHPQEGNIFNDFGWGGYLLYRLWPEQQVFIDGQTDFYGEKLTRDYEVLANTFLGWEELIERYQITHLILPIHSPLVLRLNEDPNWQTLYVDETAAILHRIEK